MADLVGYKEAAQELRRSEGWLRRAVMARSIPHVKMGGRKGRVFFLRSDLERFILEHRVDATPPGGADRAKG